MSYTKPDQAQFLDNLLVGEFVVQLDQGEFVAVSVKGAVEPNSGNSVMESTARVVNADGTPTLDANGQPLSTHYSFSCDIDGINAMGGMSEFQRKMLLSVLGEDANWINPPPVDVLNHISIRTNLAAADAAGQADVIDLL